MNMRANGNIGRVLLLTALLFIVCLNASAQGPIFDEERESALSAPGKVVLYSLEPWGANAKNSRVRFHQSIVLGSTELNSTQAASAIAELRKAVLSWKRGTSVPTCFDPLYGVSVQSGGHVYDFLLCYRCQKVQSYVDGIPIDWNGVSGSPDVLNAILVSHNVPLPPKK